MKIPLVLTACVQFHVDHLWCGYRLVNCWAFHQSAFPVLKYTNYAKRLFRLEHFQVKTKQMKESLNEREEKNWEISFMLKASLGLIQWLTKVKLNNKRYICNHTNEVNIGIVREFH